MLLVEAWGRLSIPPVTGKRFPTNSRDTRAPRVCGRPSRSVVDVAGETLNPDAESGELTVWGTAC